MDLKIKLEAQDFSDRTPTKTQTANVLGDISDFLNNLAGALLATGEYHIARQDNGGPPQANAVAQLLNASGAVKNAQDCFLGASTSGIVQPQPVAQMPRR